MSVVTSFTMSNKVKDVDLTEKIEIEAPAPEFPAALPAETTEAPATETAE